MVLDEIYYTSDIVHYALLQMFAEGQSNLFEMKLKLEDQQFFSSKYKVPIQDYSEELNSPTIKPKYLTRYIISDAESLTDDFFICSILSTDGLLPLSGPKSKYNIL